MLDSGNSYQHVCESTVPNSSVSAIALMAFSLRKYYETLNLSANGENLWNPPDQTVLWPTYFTLVSSVLTSVFAACVLAAYLYSTTTAEKIDDWRSRILWLALFLKIALEITTSSGMYATGAHGPSDGPQSLWYQTCTATRDTVELFKPWINIDQFCGMQVFPTWRMKLIVEMGKYRCPFVDYFGCFVGCDVYLLVPTLATSKNDEAPSFRGSRAVKQGRK